MLSNQIIQKSLDELKAITKTELIVYDLEGTKIAGTSSETDVEPHIVHIFAEFQKYNYHCNFNSFVNFDYFVMYEFCRNHAEYDDINRFDSWCWYDS